MANGTLKEFQKKVAEAINASLTPIEYTLDSFKAVVENVKKNAPLVYQELEQVFKENLITINSKNKTLTKKDFMKISDEVTKHVIDRLPHIQEDEMKKIVSSKGSQTFLDMVFKGLSIAAFAEKDYTVIPKEKLFKRVLIANRGEIALRVLRACRELGVETVAIYTEPDKNALTVKLADKAYCLGDASKYLDTKKIISIAKRCKADAIHPGYGFLAENAAFAELCEKNKIKFIGPSSKSIRMLGDKVVAKQTMVKANVPVVQGIQRPLKDHDEALQLAREYGYPVIIKAAAGGGGKGMRVVWEDKEVQKHFDAAQAEASLAFGDDTLYIEKYIEDPRHIEFQILADQHGKVIHLGERDCSVQRKHQKLIEEAPSPALDDALRTKMGETAVRATAASDYEGAGTVEFLLDKNNNFYFMEMNTRIQVEHGVTERVTGVDLVKEQVKLAAGAQLAFEQNDIVLDGHAIECRINAEDPANDFAPSTGSVKQYIQPGGPGVSLSSICHPGYKVLPHYDSLLSLLICQGKDREEALTRMLRALSEYQIIGVHTTIPFHETVLNNDRFRKGHFTTAFIEKEKILQVLNSKHTKQKNLTKDQKTLIVSTAVQAYVRQKKQQPANSAWVSAGRADLMEQNW